MAAPNPNALHEVDLKLVILQNEVEKMALGASAAGLPQPPPFDGQRDFVEYLRTFNRVATAHGWAPERCCQILPLFLLGSARATYESLSQADKATWKTLTDKLAEKLSKVHCKEAARFQLSNRKQKAGESVQEFASALKDLTTRAFPKSALPGEPTDAELAKFRSDTAKDFFRMGLSPELKEKILFLPVPETFEAAVQQAKEVHEMQQALKGEMLASIEADKIGKIQTEICAIREQLTQQKREGQQGGQQASKKPNYAKKPFQSNSRPNQPQNECFSCGRTGHLRKDCRVRNATCYKCQKQGHIANACRSRNQRQPSGNNSATNFYKNPNHIPIANNANNRANAVVTRSRSPSPIFPLLFIMATLISLTSCLAKPNSFQFCPNNPKNIVEIPPLKNCNISANAKFENRTMTLYLPKPRPKPFPIYRCWTLITTICTTHYSIFLSTSDPSNVTGDPPSGAKCQELAWVTKLQQNGENTFWTNFPFASEVGIWGEKCANTTNYFVEIGRAVSGKEKILTSWKVDLPFGTAGERFEKGSAFTYAWNNSDPSLWETHQLIGPVNGTIVNEKIFIIPSLQYAFHRSHHQSHEGTRGVPTNTIRLENEAFIKTEESIRSRREASSDGRIKPGTRPPKLDNRKRIQPQLRSRPTKMEAQRKTSPQPSTIASSSIAQTSATSRSTMASSTTQTQSTFATQVSPSSISTSNRPPSAMSSRATQPSTTTTSTSIRPPSSTTALSSSNTATQPSSTKQKPKTTMTPKMLTNSPTLTSTTARPSTSLTVPSWSKMSPIVETNPTNTISPYVAMTVQVKQTATVTSKTATQTAKTGEGEQERNEMAKQILALKIQLDQMARATSSSAPILSTSSKANLNGTVKRSTQDEPDTHMNSRMNFMAFNQDMKNLQFWSQQCSLRNNQIKMIISQALTNPTAAVRLLYGRGDLTAKLDPTNSSRWLVGQCTSIPANMIFWSRKVNGVCYDSLPIVVDKALLFVQPGTKDVTTNASVIPCTDIEQNIPGNQMNLQPESDFQEQPAPRIDEMVFNKGKVFKTEEEEKDEAIKAFRMKQSHPENDEIKADQPNVEEAMNQIRELAHKATEFKDSAVEAVANAKEKGEKMVEEGFGLWSKLKTIWNIVKWILIGLAIGIALILFGFIFWKFRMWFRFIFTVLNLFVRFLTFLFRLMFGKSDNMQIAAVRQNRPTPSAPEESPLTKEAYILDYIPEINSVGGPVCQFRAYVNQKPIQALFDCGAGLTYGRISAIKRCQVPIYPDENLPNARAANGTPIEFKGKAFAQIRIGAFQQEWPILVSEDTVQMN